MREIKFRAWTSVSNKMYYSDNEYGLHGFFLTFFLLASKHRVLMQYTGLQDKNGKEIYEGDIVTTPYDNGEIIYTTSFCSFRIKGAKFGLPLAERDEEDGRTEDYIEVIGNIYENGELIK